MRTCAYCGCEYGDEVQICPYDHHKTDANKTATALTVEKSSTLARISLGLGVFSLLEVLSLIPPVLFVGLILVIPAIILGHIALRSIKSYPEEYTGRSLALTGLGTGYAMIGLFFLLILLSSKEDNREHRLLINCKNNLQNIGIAERLWTAKHGHTLPDSFLEMSNYLIAPKILVCPGEPISKSGDFNHWDSRNITYRLLTPGASNISPQTVIAMCPYHHLELLADGTVQKIKNN